MAAKSANFQCTCCPRRWVIHKVGDLPTTPLCPDCGEPGFKVDVEPPVLPTVPPPERRRAGVKR